MFRSSKLSIAFVLLTGFTTSALAELRLAGIFSDQMVLQCDRPVQIWGTADSVASVSVRFAGESYATQSNETGEWALTLKPMSASIQARELAVSSGKKTLLVNDVLVGEVWHASGQSNMGMTMAAVAHRLESARQDLAEAAQPHIRFRRIGEGPSRASKADVPKGSGWVQSSAKSAANFSAAAYYFARKLHAELGVPVGIIDTSRGGTPIEPFIPSDAFGSHPTLIRERQLGDADDLHGIWKLPGGVRARDTNWLPGRLFNSRLAPIARFAVRGTIWYQAESNCGKAEDPRDYQHKMRALVTGWRCAFDHPEMPVYFVQLPGSGAGPNWPYMREQQRLSMNLANTGMAVTIDLLDTSIHPPNKIDVGDRLARWALAKTYQRKIPFSGPLFKLAAMANGKVTLYFSHSDSGLMTAIKNGLGPPAESPETKLAHFEVADRSGFWYPSEAVIEGKNVVVSSAQVPDPIAVRYGYEIDPQYCYLYNRDGLPAAPFCSNPNLLTCDPGLPTD